MIPHFFNNCCFSLNEIKVLIITVELKYFPVSLHFQTVFFFLFFRFFRKQFIQVQLFWSLGYISLLLGGGGGGALENVEHRCLPDSETLRNNVNATKEDPSKDCRTLI
jgi:hypothetical protein